MRFELLCPACGVREYDFDDYESLILLAPNLALTQFICPGCGRHLSATMKLTSPMQHKIQQRLSAADNEGVSPVADPNASVLSHASHLVVRQGDPSIEIMRPYRVGDVDAKARLEYFKRQLEVVDTVDQAIEEIDAGYYREKRDV